jgi:hypothetical protein
MIGPSTATDPADTFMVGDLVIILGARGGPGQVGKVFRVDQPSIVAVRVTEGARRGTEYLRTPEKLWWVAGPSGQAPRRSANTEAHR